MALFLAMDENRWRITKQKPSPQNAAVAGVLVAVARHGEARHEDGRGGDGSGCSRGPSPDLRVTISTTQMQPMVLEYLPTSLGDVWGKCR